MKNNYIRTTKEGREKYEVTLDEKKLEELKIRIAKNCGELSIVHKECEYGYIPHEKYMTRTHDKTIHYYEDVHYYESGNKKEDWHGYERYEIGLYYCDYKDFTCPRLVNFIDKILYMDKESIEKLFNGDLSELCSDLTVKEKIVVLKKEIDKITKDYNLKRNKKAHDLKEKYNLLDDNITNLDNKINELQAYVSIAKSELSKIDNIYNDKIQELNKQLEYLLSISSLNERQEDVSNYVKEMLNYVEYRLVDTISNEELKKYHDFFSNKTTNIVDTPTNHFSIKKKVLKR